MTNLKHPSNSSYIHYFEVLQANCSLLWKRDMHYKINEFANHFTIYHLVKLWETAILYNFVRDRFELKIFQFYLNFTIPFQFLVKILLYGDCLARVTVNKLVVRVAQWIMKSLLTAATRVQSPWSTVLYVKGYGVRPLRFFSGHSGFFPHQWPPRANIRPNERH